MGWHGYFSRHNIELFIMKVVADENIPQIQHYCADLGELLLKPGRNITRDDVFDADVLLVRSTTKVDKLLLRDTPVKFVGSTVAGLDHLDIEYLNTQNIKWFAAEGCNAVAVSEYVVCVVAALQKKLLLPQKNLRAAVIGVGRIGSLVVNKLRDLGFEVLTCDPFYDLTPLADIGDVDLISIHTPLTHGGPFPTFHLIEKNFLARQKENTVLLNAGRGSVVNVADLKIYGKHLQWCLDVFENEPSIDPEIVEAATIATPHIAGHTVQAKLRGLEMVYKEMLKQNIISIEKNFKYPEKTLHVADKSDWREFALKVYDPFQTTLQFKSQTQPFDELRKEVQERYEFNYILKV